MYGFASSGSSPGNKPIVRPPAARAPRAACSITPVSPPQSSTAWRCAMPRPTSKARSASDVWGSDSPQTATRRRRGLNDYELYRPEWANARLLVIPNADLASEPGVDLATAASERRLRRADHREDAGASP